MSRIPLVAVVLSMMGALPAQAAVLIQVDQSAQRMKVSVDGVPTFDWRVSTGKPGYDTPNGAFRPNRLDADHQSDEYDGAPMPYAIFFDLKGHAIHGTYEKIGKPGASHGCVRLEPANAKKLFDLVESNGLSKVSVQIGGDVRVAMGNSKSKPTAVAQRRTRVRPDADMASLPGEPMQIYPQAATQDYGYATYGNYGNYRGYGYDRGYSQGW